MPASPAALLVAAAALALSLVAATGSSAGSGPGTTPATSPRGAHAAGGTDASRTSGSAAATTVDTSVPTNPLGQALAETVRTGGHGAPALTSPGAPLTTSMTPTTTVTTPTSTTSTTRYVPPLDPAVVVALFDGPDHEWSAGHRGVDLAASTGVEVRAPADGVVVFAGTVVDRGVITVLHPDGLRSSLEPVDAEVSAGTEVAAGEPVGTVQGRSHCAPGPCLHWGVRRGETYLDPLDLLPGGGPTVLLPVP